MASISRAWPGTQTAMRVQNSTHLFPLGRERERERETGQSGERCPPAGCTAVHQPAHTIRGRAVPTVQGRATGPLPRRIASDEKDSGRTVRLSPVGPHEVKGPDTEGDVQARSYRRRGRPPDGRLAAARRAATGQPPPPRPGTEDAWPRVHTGRQKEKGINAARRRERRGGMTAPRAVKKVASGRQSEG